MNQEPKPFDPYSPLPLDQIPAELGVLLSAVRMRLGLAEVESFKAMLQRELNWEQLLEAGRWHRLHNVLFTALREVDADVPDHVMTSLEQGYRTNAGRNLKLTSLLFRLLGVFNEANIPVLVIKGLALAGPLYGDVALRRSGDVDVLIHPDQVQQAMELMCKMEGCTTPPLDKFSFDVLMRTDNEMKIYLNDELVELQWRLAPMHALYPVHWEGLYAEAENVSMAGRGVPTLGTMEMLPYLCFHGTKHLWYRLFWLMDVAAWMRWKQDWPWQEVLGRAHGRGHARSMFLGLALAHHLFGAPLPDGIHRILREHPIIGERVNMIRNMVMPQSGKEYEPAVSDFTWWKNIYWMSPSWRHRTMITWRYLFQPTIKDIEAFSLPRVLAPLYYALRPVRLGRSALKMLIRK